MSYNDLAKLSVELVLFSLESLVEGFPNADGLHVTIVAEEIACPNPCDVLRCTCSHPIVLRRRIASAAIDFPALIQSSSVGERPGIDLACAQGQQHFVDESGRVAALMYLDLDRKCMI